jgi:hypothetical protein
VELLVITASRSVSVPALKIPPPLFSKDPALVPPPLPPVIATPEIETIMPDPTVNARSMTVLLLASIVTLDAPGPAIVRCVLIVRLPLVRLMTAGYVREKTMVSPEPALSMASRREPGPLSLVFTTVNVLPKAGHDDDSNIRYGRDLAANAWNSALILRVSSDV